LSPRSQIGGNDGCRQPHDGDRVELEHLALARHEPAPHPSIPAHWPEVGSRLAAAIAAVMHDRAQEERAATGSARQAPLHGERAASIGPAGDDAEVGARLLERVRLDVGLGGRLLDVVTRR
jgi:hypothetical protein